MTGATMCSGIGAPEQAMPWVEWQWHAEIEPFPSAVLAQRHGTPNLGNITAADFIDRALACGPLGLLVAGTPCQAFSVAGRRESLADTRGNLTLRFVEIVDAIQPRLVLWENVPGVLSTQDNAFGCFLGALAGTDSALVPARRQRWTDAGVVDGPARRIAWRVLDAQYLGLAQRRERVFVVASPRDGADPAEILFEREGVQRRSPPSREAGEGTTGTLSARTKRGGGLGTDFDCSGGLVPEISMCLNAGAMGRIDGESETFIAHSLRGEGFDASEDGTGRGTPIVPVAIPILEAGARTGKSTTDVRAGIGIGEDGDPMYTLQSGKQHGIAFTPDMPQGYRIQNADGVCETLSANPQGGMKISPVMAQMAVRRLTPRECERLQGFPDDFTLIEHRCKQAADGPRYKALGNSMAVPVIAWIGKRIADGDA